MILKSLNLLKVIAKNVKILNIRVKDIFSIRGLKTLFFGTLISIRIADDT
jgi:hypothetical protein